MQLREGLLLFVACIATYGIASCQGMSSLYAISLQRFSKLYWYILLYCALEFGDLRLEGGLNACEGRLEIFSNTVNQWVPACSSSTGTPELRVICRTLQCLNNDTDPVRSRATE